MTKLSIFETVVSVDTSVLIILVSAITLLICGLLLIIYLLNKKLRATRSIKYGFGGKTLYSLIALLVISITIPVVLTVNSTDIRYSAKEERKIVLAIDQPEDSSEVQMIATPFIDDQVFTGKYTVVWNIRGPQSMQIEQREKNGTSSINQVLIQGDYTVEITITTEDGTTFTKSESFHVE